MIRAGYHLLGLQTYFTAFERGFIRAETASDADFVANDGWKGAREKGVVRSEGKEYVVQDGDLMLYRFNV